MSEAVGQKQEELQEPLLSAKLAQADLEDEQGNVRWRGILRRIAVLAGPLVISNVFGYALSVIAAISVGRLNDPTIFSAVVLAGSFYNVTGLSLVVGLSAGCDTIAGQAYGAKNYRLVGETLQRAVLICCTLCLPVITLWAYAGPLMLALHQSPEIVPLAARYLHLASPSLFMSAVSGNISRYLVVQRVVAPGSYCTAITALLCPLYNWLLIHKLDMGLDGAALALNASNLTYTLLMVGVVTWHARRMRGSPKQTWSGFSAKAAFSRWPQFLKYGIPAAAMLCCEWWVFELVILMAGSLPDADLAVAVMGITFHVTCIAFMLPASVGTACNTCIANALGAGHAYTARAVFRVSFSMVACIQAILATMMYFGGSLLAQLFTGAQEVVELAEATMPLVALCVVFDGLNALLSSALRGCGRQVWGAALNLIGYWLVGFPLAVYLGFGLNMSTKGFWAALAAASSSQACIQMAFIGRLNWQREVARAAALLAAHAADYAPTASDEEQGMLNGTAAGVENEDRGQEEEGLAPLISDSIAPAAGVTVSSIVTQNSGGMPIHGARRSISGAGSISGGERSWLFGSVDGKVGAVQHRCVGAVLQSQQQASQDLDAAPPTP